MFMSELNMNLALEKGSFSLKIHARVPQTGILGVWGESGSGKTTLLRCLAGLETQALGTIQIGEHLWLDSQTNRFTPPWQRDIGYVFQEASLFKHLRVLQNIEFGFKRVSPPASSRPKTSSVLRDAISLLGLEHLLDRYPHELSGGERQRVAIARALATQPSVLLLDEPMSALDQNKKGELYPWIEKLTRELRIPIVLVSHSIEEIARLTQHLLILQKGRLLAHGPTAEILSSIETPYDFGEHTSSILQGTVKEIDTSWGLARIEFDPHDLWIENRNFSIGQEVKVRILARDVSLSHSYPTETSIQNLMACTITGLRDIANASQCLVQLQCGSQILSAKITRRAYASLDLYIGCPIWAQIKSAAMLT